jgi:hypothetical protein
VTGESWEVQKPGTVYANDNFTLNGCRMQVIVTTKHVLCWFIPGRWRRVRRHYSIKNSRWAFQSVRWGSAVEPEAQHHKYHIYGNGKRSRGSCYRGKPQHSVQMVKGDVLRAAATHSPSVHASSTFLIVNVDLFSHFPSQPHHGQILQYRKSGNLTQTSHTNNSA